MHEAKATEERVLPREETHGLRLRTPSGDIRVTGTATEQIQVTAHRQVRSENEEAAEAFLAQIQVRHHQDGDRWVVEASWPEPRPHGVQSPQVGFEVSMPANLVLEARTGHGSIQATGISEPRLRTGSGDIRAGSVTGTLEVHSGHGSVQIDGCESEATAETSSGDIRVRLARGPVKATTGHGSIRLEECEGPAQIETRSGDVGVQRLSARLDASTGHGSIQVEDLPEAHLRTGSGDLRVGRIAGACEAESGHGSIQVEECAGPVEVRTGSGDIRVSRAENRVRARTGHGSIRLTQVGEAELQSGSGDLHASHAAGSVEARTGHGSIRIDACAGDVAAESRSGDIEVRQARGVLRATTGHGSLTAELAPDGGSRQVELSGGGSINLVLPGNTSARLEAVTSAGVIEVDPGVPSGPGSSPGGRRNQWSAVLGAGDGSIRLRTSHGSIRIRQAPAG